RREAGGATCGGSARSPRKAALVGEVQRYELAARAHLLRGCRSMRRAPRAGELALAAARAEGHARGSLTRGGGQGREPGAAPLSRAKNSPLAGRSVLGPCRVRAASRRHLAARRSSGAAAAARSAVRAAGRLAVAGNGGGRPFGARPAR